MRSRILVVSREVTVRARLARMLSAAGYAVELAESAVHARHVERKGLALSIVAAGGLGREGDGLIEDLMTSNGKVLLLSGASDYAGLLARVTEALRPVAETDAAEPVLLFAGYRLDPAGRSLVDGSEMEVPLTRGEFGLLHSFVQRPGRVLSRDQLLNALAGRDAEAYDRSIDMLVVRLRRKIELDPKHPRLILTVPGSGYKFAAKVRQAEATAPEIHTAAAPPETTPAAAERRYVTALAAELLPAEVGGLPGDPEELRALIDAFRRYAARVVARHGGVLAESRVREVLAYFGHPVAQEHANEHAIHAGLALAEHLAEGDAALPAGLAVRVGVATGLVVADMAGEVLGETPGEAMRLLTLAEPGQVFIAASTRRLVGGLFTYRDLGPLTVKGVAGPVQASHVLGPSPLGSRSEALYADTLMPLVDREEEGALLLRAWQQAKSGEGRLVLLSGEPGIGKSRLLAALEEELAAEPHATLRYFCSPLHQDSALHPIIARWEKEVGFARGDSSEQRLHKLEAVLGPAALPPENVALIAAMLSVATGPRYPQLDLSPQRRKQRTFAALYRWLDSVSGKQPALMLFEDAHWADPSSLELLDEVVERIAELPILLVVSYRPEFAAPWIGRAGASLIALGRLNRRHSATLAAQVTVERVLTGELLERIVTQTDGVPLFIEELTKAVLETSAGADKVTLPLAVPGTLQASLMARLDRLPAAKQVAQIGAVIGREFPHALLTVVAGLAEARLARGVDELVASGLAARRGMVPEVVYTFKHALVQDAAYESLLKSRRQVLHRCIAEALRDRFAARAEAEPEVVARHFTEAQLHSPAVEWWAKAAELALHRSAYPEAIEQIGRAIQLAELVEDGPAQRLSRLRLQVTYGQALMAARGYNGPGTKAAFERAREIAAKIEDSVERYAVYFGLWAGAWTRGELPLMEELVADFIRDVTAGPNVPQSAVAYASAGMTCWFRGDFAAARPLLEQAHAASDPVFDPALAVSFGCYPAVIALTYLALTLWPLGEVDEAKRRSEEAVSLAERGGHAPSVAYAVLHKCTLEATRGEVAAVRAESGLILRRAKELGLWQYVAWAQALHGWAAASEGDSDGLTEIATARAFGDQHGIQAWRPFLGAMHAETVARERPDDAVALLEEDRRDLERTGQRWAEAELHRQLGKVQLRRVPPDHGAAEAAFHHAIDVAQGQGAPTFVLRAALPLARLMCEDGRDAAARALLAPVIAGFPQSTSALPELAEARVLLGTLA